MLSARPDLKKYTAVRFQQEVQCHGDAISPGEDVVLVFMKALGLEPPLTPVCSDLYLQMEGRIQQVRAMRAITEYTASLRY